jgi:hypothetical protein
MQSRTRTTRQVATLDTHDGLLPLRPPASDTPGIVVDSMHRLPRGKDALVYR